MKTFQINSLSELKSFASDLAGKLKSGSVVALSGPLGAGKTTLVQMLARELGIKQSITSPSFTIFKLYDLPKPIRGIKKFCHIDLYRINKAEKGVGFEEYLGEEDTVCFIEWAEKMKSTLPKSAVWITVKVESDGSRTITL